MSRKSGTDMAPQGSSFVENQTLTRSAASTPAAMDRRSGIPTDRSVTETEALAVLDSFRRDPALRGALGTAVQTHRYGGPLLQSLLPYVTAAREALRER